MTIEEKKNMKEKVKGLSLVALSSIAAVTVISGVTAANAASPDSVYQDDIHSHRNSMNVDVSTEIDSFEDVNSNGLIDEGDIINYNVIITNNSELDYNYVDISSLYLELERELITSNLPAGETIIFNDALELNNYTSTNYSINVNIRDLTNLEKTVTSDFFYFAKGYGENCQESSITDTDSPNYIDACLPNIINWGEINVDNYDFDSVPSMLSGSARGGIIFDVSSEEYLISDDDNTDYYTGELDVISVDRNELLDRMNIGDHYVTTFVVHGNESGEDITLTGIKNLNGEIVDENFINEIIPVGESREFYLSRLITQEVIDWGISNYMSGGGNTDFHFTTTRENIYSITNTSMGSSQSTRLQSSIGSLTENNNYYLTYNYSTDYMAGQSLYAGYVISEKFGEFELDGELIIPHENYSFVLPEIIDGDNYTESGYVIAYGKYFTSVTPNPSTVAVTTPIEEEPPIVEIPEAPVPYLTTPLCGVSMSVVLPESDDFTYDSVIDEENNLKVFVTATYNETQEIVDEWWFTLDAVVECPVDEPDIPRKIHSGEYVPANSVNLDNENYSGSNVNDKNAVLYSQIFFLSLLSMIILSSYAGYRINQDISNKKKVDEIVDEIIEK